MCLWTSQTAPSQYPRVLKVACVQRESNMLLWFSQTDAESLTTEAMAMGKLHKDIGQLIVQSAEDAEKSDSQVIKVRT